jgi:hypothetical protein
VGTGRTWIAAGIEQELYCMADAVIIPFPMRTPVVSDQEKLAAALESLRTALEEQRSALSDWRFAMTELGIGVAGLGHSLAGYQHALGSVEDRLSGLRQEATRLEAWADGALMGEGLAPT